MKNYKNAHRWLMVALLIVILGFVRSYWSQFPHVSFPHHLHLLFATGWFALLVWQPKLATTGRLEQHRRNGMIGLFLAGAVVGTSLLMVPGNIEDAVAGRVGGGGFVNPTFFYGVSFYDLVAISGFTLAVIMAVIQRKQPEAHALWMVTTALWILGPALARLLILPVAIIRGGLEGITFFFVINLALTLVLITIAIMAWRLKRFPLPLVLVAAGNVVAFLCEPIGDWPAWRSLMEAVFIPPPE